MGKKSRSKITVQHSNGNYSLREPSLKIVVTSGIVIFVIAFMIYTPALKNGFVDWDDYTYIYENTNINTLSARTLYWMLTTFHANNWHPLTWLSHAVDYSMFGLNPWGHHLGSIFLHALNTLLVFILVLQLVIQCEAREHGSIARVCLIRAVMIGTVTAMLFGIHPIHVESVVWSSERKDLLCAFFVLLSLCAYSAYGVSPAGDRKLFRFVACILLAALALMSKPMAVSLPLILLLLDVYPLRRFRGSAERTSAILLEKLPFVAMSVATGIITLRAQHISKAISGFGEFDNIPFSNRLLNGIHALVFYLWKMFVPSKLIALYPHPLHIRWTDLQYLAAIVLTVLITAFCLWLSTRGRHLLSSIWFYYVATLLPVLGIIQVGMQSAADRYTYLPSISIFLLAVLGMSWIWNISCLKRYEPLKKGFLLLVLSCIMCILGVLTVRQIGIWRTSESLWKYVISHEPVRVPIAYNNLGNALARAGKREEATAAYEKALALNPDLVDARNNLGNLYSAMKMYDKAIAEYETVLAVNPSHVKAHNNLGFVYYKKGLYDEAVAEYIKAMTINAAYAKAHYNLSLAYYAKQMFDEARAEYEKALAIEPHLDKIYGTDLGKALANVSRSSVLFQEQFN